jgi:hypothetical protein
MPGVSKSSPPPEKALMGIGPRVVPGIADSVGRRRLAAAAAGSRVDISPEERSRQGVSNVVRRRVDISPKEWSR